ncbi:hypothetical protein, partial [Nocardia asiatica]
ASRTRRPLGREPGRERAMLGLASLETWVRGALGASVVEAGAQCTLSGVLPGTSSGVQWIRLR